MEARQMIPVDWKYWVAEYLVKPFKSCGVAGRFRFWVLFWVYRLTGWHIRHKEWEFILDYLPPLGKWQSVRVFDVGCAKSLFCYEVVERGYTLTGIDLSPYQEEYPGTFYQADIRSFQGDMRYDFVTCISVLEHIDKDQAGAVRNMINRLTVGGRLLLTIPTHEFAIAHPWHGFSYQDVLDMLPSNARVLEYTERMGQICLAIERFQ